MSKSATQGWHETDASGGPMNYLTVDGDVVAPVEMATTAKTRSKGLLGRTGLSGALWLAPARQVHTFRMKFAIDVAHVDKSGTVTHVVTMPPGRVGRWAPKSKGVIEAEAGAFEKWNLTVGSLIGFTTPDGAAV